MLVLSILGLTTYPLRVLLGFFFWIASYLGNEVLWREKSRASPWGFHAQTRRKLLARPWL